MNKSRSNNLLKTNKCKPGLIWKGVGGSRGEGMGEGFSVGGSRGGGRGYPAKYNTANNHATKNEISPF